jgi:hypothetical protein
MDRQYKQIIKQILTEEIMGEQTFNRLLEWYDTWNKKLSESVVAEDYCKVVTTQFKTGLGLLTSMKTVMRNHPEYKPQLKEKFETVKSKLIVINNVRKSIDTIK